jgi:hypothetical protein
VSCTFSEDDDGEFSYRRDAGNGPARWGLIRREWSACAYGRLQSPIGLSDTVARITDRRGRLGRRYRPAAASLVNRGHDVMVRFNSNAGGVVVDGVAYRLRQMHWHTPSENAVNGRRYAMELHMLHESEDGKFAVVAQLYRIGRRSDTTISRVSICLASRHQQKLIITSNFWSSWSVCANTRNTCSFAAQAVHREDRVEEGRPRGAHRRGGGPAAVGAAEHRVLPVHGLLHDAAVHGGRHVAGRQEGAPREAAPGQDAPERRGRRKQSIAFN